MTDNDIQIEGAPPAAPPTTPPPAGPAQIAAALAEPFPPDVIEWKAQVVKGDRALAVPYIDARIVMDRLDHALGIGNWETSYTEFRDGVVCRLRVRIGEDWFEHEDVGSQSDQPDKGDKLKAAFSDGLKRVAVHVGVGRYLYRLPPQWVAYNSASHQFASTPKLPSWALPAGAPKLPLVAKPETNSSVQTGHAFPEDGSELESRLADYDQDLSEQGLFAPGELLRYVLQTVAKTGPKPGKTYGSDVRTWPAAAIKLAIQETKSFEARARANAERKQRTLNHLAGKEA